MFEFSSATVIKVIRPFTSYLKFIAKIGTKSMFKIIEIMIQLPVWKNFTAIAGKNSAKCDICGHEIKTSTSTMRYHLVQVHKVRLPASKDESEEPSAKKAKQSTITAFVKKQSIEELMAEMTAKDWFTFHTIANSSFIR